MAWNWKLRRLTFELLPPRNVSLRLRRRRTGATLDAFVPEQQLRWHQSYLQQIRDRTREVLKAAAELKSEEATRWASISLHIRSLGSTLPGDLRCFERFDSHDESCFMVFGASGRPQMSPERPSETVRSSETPRTCGDITCRSRLNGNGQPLRRRVASAGTLLGLVGDHRLYCNHNARI